jgi:hypothetical protein
MHTGGSDRRGTATALALILFLPLAALAFTGCSRTDSVSDSYFAVEEGNSWLYRAREQAAELTMELAIVEPDPAIDHGPRTVDVSASGSTGKLKLSEEGYLLEGDEGSLALVSTGGSGGTPYLLLESPLVVGRTYYPPGGDGTAAEVTVTSAMSVGTPSGPREGFELQISGEGIASGVRLIFVPNVGFTTLDIPGFPTFELEDAALR